MAAKGFPLKTFVENCPVAIGQFPLMMCVGN